MGQVSLREMVRYLRQVRPLAQALHSFLGFASKYLKQSNPTSRDVMTRLLARSEVAVKVH